MNGSANGQTTGVDASDLERLRVNELLVGLDDKVFKKFAKNCTFVPFEQGSRLIEEGASQDCIFLVVKGTVRVVQGEDRDVDLVYREIDEGGWFGEISALDRGQRSATIHALTDGVVVMLPRVVFINLILEHRQIAVKVMESLAHVIRTSNQQFKGNTSLSPTQRVYQQLLNLAEKDPDDGTSWVVTQVPSHDTLANDAMTSREVVADALSSIYQDGVAKRSLGRLVIRDHDRLKHLATQR